MNILDAYSIRFGPDRIEQITADLRELSGASRSLSQPTMRGPRPCPIRPYVALSSAEPVARMRG